MSESNKSEEDNSPTSTLLSMLAVSSTWEPVGSSAMNGMDGSEGPVSTTVEPGAVTDADDDDSGGTPSVEQKMFLVMSVALATVCFFTNAVQIGVFMRGGAVRSVKSLLLLSQACSGLVAAAVVAFPIHVISARGGVGATDEGFNACYMAHSGVILLSLLTSLSTATLLLLDHHLHRHHNAKYVASGSSLLGWGIGITVVWIWALMVSMLPWLGWNTWLAHDARCHLSTLWPLSFTAFVTFLVAVHVALALLMWASGRATTLHDRHTHQRLRAQGQVIEEDLQNASVSSEGGVRVAGWLISLSSVVPVLGHVVLASSCAASTQCTQSARHYHEDTASLPWASLLLAAAAVANPLLYVFSDDQVSSATLHLLTRLCCVRQRNGAVVLRQNSNTPSSSSGGGGGSAAGAPRPPQQTAVSAECGTGTFVTSSDTQQLVADNT